METKPRPETSDVYTYATEDRVKLIDDLFTYHAPDPDQVARLAKVRAAAKAYALAIDANCPPSVDRTAAIRQLQDSNMTANRSIVLHGRSYR